MLVSYWEPLKNFLRTLELTVQENSKLERDRLKLREHLGDWGSVLVYGAIAASIRLMAMKIDNNGNFSLLNALKIRKYYY